MKWEDRKNRKKKQKKEKRTKGLRIGERENGKKKK